MNINLDKQESNLAITFVLIFALSLILRIWFNFFTVHANAAFACDAAEYLRDAQGLALSLTKLFGQSQSLSTSIQVLFGYGNANEMARVKDIFAPMQEMSISGPVFPTFLLVCYKLFGQDPSFNLWMIPIAIQCLLSALMSVLIASIGNACWGKITGMTAGILAALYPGFIVNSGRLYSESFACFLTCLVLWLVISYLANGKTHYKWGFLLGICLFSLQTTRSIMVILSFAILVFFAIASLLTTEGRLAIVKYTLAIAAAFLICLLPWLAVQKIAFGKASLIVDRVGNYNLFMGNNVDTLGWLSIPYPDSTGMEKENHCQLLKQAVRRSPKRWLTLMLDKPVRLLKLPWNDFKVWIGPISPAVQAIFHQLILVFAAIGLIFIYIYFDLKYKRPKILARALILFTLLLHLAYLAFITVPRYNLTAMPEVILFASAGLVLTMQAFKSRQSVPKAIRLLLVIVLLILLAHLDIISAFAVRFSTTPITLAVTLAKLALSMSIILKALTLGLFFLNCWRLTPSVTFSGYDNFSRRHNYALIPISLLALFALPAYCLPLRAHGRWYEWSQDLHRSSERAYRLLDLTDRQARQLAHGGAYLAVNLSGGANLASDWDFFINDVKLTGPFIPSLSMAQDLSLVHLDNGINYTIEQESILKILCGHCAISPLDLRQWYLIPISAQQGTGILKHVDQTHFHSNSVTLSLTIYKRVGSPGALYGAYPLDRHFTMVPSLFRFSWEKAFYGVENGSGISDPAYDQKISLHQASDNAYMKLLLPSSPISNKLNPSDSLSLAQTEYKQVNFTGSSLVLSFKPKDSLASQSKKNGYWLVRLFGELRNSDTYKDASKIVLWTRINFSNSPKYRSYISPWTPNYLPSNSQILPATNVKEDIQSNASPIKFDICFPIMISAFPDHLDEIELHLSTEGNKTVADVSKSEQAKCCLEIYQTKTLPSGVRYEIF